MKELPKIQTVLSDSAKQVLGLMIDTLNQNKAEDLRQETLTTLIESSEFITTSLRFIRDVNYKDKNNT
jgi:hypothetical protein